MWFWIVCNLHGVSLLGFAWDDIVLQMISYCVANATMGVVWVILFLGLHGVSLLGMCFKKLYHIVLEMIPWVWFVKRKLSPQKAKLAVRCCRDEGTGSR